MRKLTRLVTGNRASIVNNQKQRLFSTCIRNQVEKEVEVKELEKGQVWIIDNLFSEEECKSYIELAESKGFDDAPVTVGVQTFKMMKDYRNNKRVILDDHHLAKEIYSKVKPYTTELAEELNVNSKRIDNTFYQICGVNERFRFYKYTSDEFFKPHFDGIFKRDNLIRKLENGEEQLSEECSFITMLLYLNTCEKGGETNILNSVSGTVDERVRHSVSPSTGRVLLFVHHLLHEAVHVAEPWQVKYVLRTDIMYRRPMSMFSSVW